MSNLRHHILRGQNRNMQTRRMPHLRITSLQISFRARVRRRSRTQIRTELDSHSDGLDYGRAVEHLHDGAGSGDALEDGA
jgi:hypothetical protein